MVDMSEIHSFQHKDDRADNQRDQSPQGQKAHADSQSHRHGKKDKTDLSGRAGCTSKPYQTEGSQYRHRSAQVSVDDHNHR